MSGGTWTQLKNGCTVFDINKFLNEKRACLVAPAGYGKTHAIVECLKAAPSRQLVLTHTHAGVASLKDKIAHAGIPSAKYELLTIAAFAQRLAIAYTNPNDGSIPSVVNSQSFFIWEIMRAQKLAECKFIADMIALSYRGIIVDEYQDCTITQHGLIMTLAERLPLRVFGDPMQGIFGFKEPIIDFDVHLSEFTRYQLTVPHRWSQTNPRLGHEIADVRSQLCRRQPLDFSRFLEIKHVTLSIQDYQNYLLKLCSSWRKEGTTVVIVSNPISREARIGVARLFNGGCSIVEAIDDKEFYELAQQVDALTKNKVEKVFYEIACVLFFKTGVDAWMTPNGVINKRDEKKRIIAKALSDALETLKENPTANNFRESLRVAAKLPNVVLIKHEKWFSLMSALQSADINGETVFDAMVRERNMVRGMGRKILRFAVGTTLLTKGLEFDNVIVLNSGQKFALNTDSGRRHFYVAVSRARKKLCIMDIAKDIP